MTAVILVIHLLLAIALVCVVLLQRSEGGALGMGGGGGMGGFMTGRATADLLTRTTTVLAACFMASSLTLAFASTSSVSAAKPTLTRCSPWTSARMSGDLVSSMLQLWEAPFLSF